MSFVTIPPAHFGNLKYREYKGLPAAEDPSNETEQIGRLCGIAIYLFITHVYVSWSNLNMILFY